MEKGGRSKGQRDAIREGHHTTSGFQEEELKAWANQCGQPLEARRGKEMDFPLASRKELSPVSILILGQWDPCWNSNPHKGEITCLWCFEPLSLLWQQNIACITYLLPHNKPPENVVT